MALATAFSRKTTFLLWFTLPAMRPYTTINTIFTIWLKLNFVPVISIKSLRLSDAYMRLWSYHIGSDNGLSPGRRQAIIWTNAEIVKWTLRNKLQSNFIWNSKVFIKDNVLENVVCEIVIICLGLNALAISNGLRRRDDRPSHEPMMKWWPMIKFWISPNIFPTYPYFAWWRHPMETFPA